MPATRGLTGRFLLAVASCPGVSPGCEGSAVQRLLQSRDGVRFTQVPGVARRAGNSPTAVRRGSRLYLFDDFGISGETITGTVRRFRVLGGSLRELPSVEFRILLASPEDAVRATSVTGSVLRDTSGALVALYALRLEPDTGACPVPGQACLKLRTATESAGSDGTLFTGDPGNRRVVSFDPAETGGDPSAYPGQAGYVILTAGPGACLKVFVAVDLHGAYRTARGLPDGCITDAADIATPSGTYRPELREHWLYAVSGGTVVRGVAGRVSSPVPPSRIRELTGLGRLPSLSARFALNAP